MVGGRLVGLPGLVVAPPGEPLLALSARLGPALDVALADLGLDEPLPRQPRHREAALADQQEAPVVRGRVIAARRRGVVRRPVVLRVERQPRRGTSTRPRPPVEAAVRDGQRGPPCRSPKLRHPPLDPLAGDQDGRHGLDANGTGRPRRTSDGACVSAPQRSSACLRQPARSPAAAPSPPPRAPHRPRPDHQRHRLRRSRSSQVSRRSHCRSRRRAHRRRSPSSARATASRRRVAPTAGSRPARAAARTPMWAAAPTLSPRTRATLPELYGVEAVDFTFPVRGWTFQASFTQADELLARCHHTYTVTVRRVRPRQLPPAGHRARPATTWSSCSAPDHRATTPASFRRRRPPRTGCSPDPTSYIGILWTRHGQVDGTHGLNLSVSGLAETPTRAEATVTATAANGHSLTVDAGKPQLGCPAEGAGRLVGERSPSGAVGFSRSVRRRSPMR